MVILEEATEYCYHDVNAEHTRIELPTVSNACCDARLCIYRCNDFDIPFNGIEFLHKLSKRKELGGHLLL